MSNNCVFRSLFGVARKYRPSNKVILVPKTLFDKAIVKRNVFCSSVCFGKGFNSNRPSNFPTDNVKLVYRQLGNLPQKDEPEKKLSLYQKLKLMYKQYWYVLVPVHLVTSAFWFSGFYYLAVTGVDIVKLLEMTGTPETWVDTMRGSKAGGIVTAYTLYKLATPARYTVTLGGTTVSINYLKKWGWIKPIPTKEQLKVIYEDKKTQFKDLQERIQVTKDEIKDEFKKTADDFTSHVKEANSGLRNSMNETKQDLKQGVREAAEEWKHVGKLVKQRTGQMLQRTADDFKQK